MRAQGWFQRRRVGLGWRPAAWQGWLTTLVSAAAVILIFAAYAIVAPATGGATQPGVRLQPEETHDTDVAAARVVSRLFDRERLIAGRSKHHSLQPDEGVP
jgi:hypothetical protein